MYGTVSAAVCVEVKETQRDCPDTKCPGFRSLLRYSYKLFIPSRTRLVKSDHISNGKSDRRHYRTRFTPLSDGEGICSMVMFTTACFHHTSNALVQGVALNLQPL